MCDVAKADTRNLCVWVCERARAHNAADRSDAGNAEIRNLRSTIMREQKKQLEKDKKTYSAMFSQ